MLLRRIYPPKQPIPSQNFTITNTINTNIHNVFTIYHFQPNKLLEIIYNDSKIKYLSSTPNGAEITLESQENECGKQKWVVEIDDIDPEIYYIKSQLYNKTGIKYMGCPNKSGFAYLYTSKNKYTKWRILPLGKSMYKFNYAGEKFDPSKVELVVARYSESVDWVMAYNDIAVIYNKGPTRLVGFQRVVNVENIGREGHTYLYHIVQNYEKLTENTIFVQGEPFLHNPTILSGIDNHDMLQPVQPLGLRYLRSCNLPPLEYVERSKIQTSFGLEYLVVSSDADLISPDFHDVGMIEMRLNADKDYPDVKYRGKPLVEGFLIRAGFPSKPLFGQTIKFTFCGLFSVCKANILQFSLENYRGLMDELVRKNPQGGVNGYVLEKTWLYIFDSTNYSFATLSRME